MSWNYRVVELPGDWHEIKEVYYDDEGNPNAYSDTVVSGETPDDIRWELRHMLEALDKPVLKAWKIGKRVFSEDDGTT